MLDIHRSENAALIPLPPIEFVRIDLASLASGEISVSLTATTVDDEEPQLLELEITQTRVSTLDEVLALIRAHVRIGSSITPLPRQN